MHLFRFFLWLSIIAFSNLRCGDQHIAANADYLQILKRVETYYDDFSNRNWEAYQSHFWEKSIIATIWSPEPDLPEQLYAQTAEEFVAQADEGPGSKPIFEESMTSHQILQEGNVAVVWAHYDAKFGDENELMKWSGVDAFTLLKLNESWKIVSIGFASTH